MRHQRELERAAEAEKRENLAQEKLRKREEERERKARMTI
jgi:hypothetical protein